MDRALNIAHCVESYPPAAGGMAEVVRQLSERMVSMGHTVTVFTGWHPERNSPAPGGVAVRAFRAGGNAVDGMHGEIGPYLQALKEGRFDVITFFAAQQWTTDAALPHLAEIPSKKAFVPTGFSALRDPRWAAYYAQMPQWMRAMDVNIFLSHGYQDVRFAQEHGIAGKLIPNGAASEEFTLPAPAGTRERLGLRPGQRLLVHIGSYTGIKGHREALDMFITASARNAVLLLTGNGNGRLEKHFRGHWRWFPLRARAWWKRKEILFRELDRLDTVAALKAADLFLFPSNLECSPIVLFEAAAAGVPFLASQAGNAAEIAEWTRGGWTIPGRRDAQGREWPDIRQGAKLLDALLEDPPRARAAGERGRAAWQAGFTWQQAAERYVAAYRELLDPGA